MPSLANHKHELFAQGLAKGETADAAYVAAGYKENRHNASRLKTNETIINRVAELQERAAIRVELTALDIVEMLEKDRKFARKCKQSGSAVAATLGMAKVLGFLKDKIEHSGPDGGPIDHRVSARAEIEDIFGPTPHLIEKHG
jgi:hypothetical protein